MAELTLPQKQALALAAARARASQANESTVPPVADFAAGVASGIPRGVVETLAAPLTIPDAINDYVLQPTIGRVADATLNAVEDVGRFAASKLGSDIQPLNPDQKAARSKKQAEFRNRDSFVDAIMKPVRKTMDDNLYAPRGTAGEYGRTIGEFAAPGALFGKGPAASRFIGDILIPALASESAGQLTDGTQLEPWARLLGGLGANVAVGARRNRLNAGENAIREAVNPEVATPEMFSKAKALQQNPFGVNVTGYNAVEQASNGGTKLTDLQRVVEGSTRGGAVLKPYFNKVPGQVSAAGGSLLDDIAPATTTPELLGPRANTAANTAIENARKGINNATQLDYAASASTRLPTDVLSSDPNYARAAQWVRANLKGFDDVTDDSVAMADAVSKRLYDEAASAANQSNSSFSNQIAAERGASAQSVRDLARDADPRYNTALNVQEIRRNDVLAPLEQGPVGKIAASNDTNTVLDVLFNPKPMTGSDIGVAKTLMRLGEQDPALPAQLTRQALADSFDTQTGRLVGGENYYGGARFAKDVAGTAQKEANLNSALSVAADPDTVRTFNEFIDVLRATGRRAPVGSQTAFNAELNNALGAGNAGGAALNTARGGLNAIPQFIHDASRRMWLGKNVDWLARLGTDPNSVDKLAEIVMRASETPIRNAVRVGAVAGPSQARERDSVDLRR